MRRQRQGRGAAQAAEQEHRRALRHVEAQTARVKQQLRALRVRAAREDAVLRHCPTAEMQEMFEASHVDVVGLPLGAARHQAQLQRTLSKLECTQRPAACLRPPAVPSRDWPPAVPSFGT